MLGARPWAFGLIRAGALVGPALVAALWGWLVWRDVLQIATLDAESEAELVAQYAERLIQTQDVLHHAVRARARVLPTGGLKSQPFHLFLKALDEGQNFNHGIIVMGFDSRIIASSRRYPIDAAMGPRAYIDAVVAGSPRFVDRVRLSPTGEDAIVVASPMRTAGMDGLVVSGFPAAGIAEFLRGMASGPGEAASIMRLDGMILLRNFESDPVMLPPTVPGRVLLNHMDKGSFIHTAVTDGVRRIYAFHRVRDMDLVANFGIPVSAVWRDWLLRTVPVFAFLALMGLAGFAAITRMRSDMLARFEAEANQKRMEAAERLAEERTRLIRETNHRVKNNLALVVSLINLQMRGKSGIDGAELKSRIGAISHVHDLMFQAEDGVHVDIGTLLRDIATSPAIAPRESNVTVECTIEPGILLGPDRSTPLALIVAELVTNAVKHAYRDGAAGTVHVDLRRDEDTCILTVADKGVGLPADGRRRSGTAIVEALVEQIGARLLRSTTEGAGTRLTLTFAV